MARQPAKINEVITMLGEGKSSKEIMAETDCCAATLSVARKRLKAREGDLEAATVDVNADVDENVDSFIKSIKITPDADVLTKDKPKETAHTYSCPSCDHEWEAEKSERQDSCPNCGLEFN